MDDYEYIKKKYSCYRQMDKEDLYVWLDNLRQENKRLKDNWNKLKAIVKSQSDFKQKLGNDRVYFEIDELLNKMQELENGDSDE